MHKFFLFSLLFFSGFLFGQGEYIEVGIYPSEYAEGMPPEDFQNIEDEIVLEIQKVPRYKIVKTQEDFYDANVGEDIFLEMEKDRKENKQTVAPYFFQIVFGDTEWSSKHEKLVTQKQVIKDSVVVTPEKFEMHWTNAATLWVTLNMYKVETGELVESLVFSSKSSEHRDYLKRSIIDRKDHKRAVHYAKLRLTPKIRARLKSLVPLKVQLLDPIDQSDKSINTIGINAGTFHGLRVGDKIYVYYDHEHIIKGKSVIREIDAGSLVIEEIKEKTAICKVKHGNKKLKRLIEEGKDLKCNFKDFIGWVDGYGF